MRPAFKLIPDFIVPNLENATYGRHLKWEDKTRGSFKVSRIHQNSELWSDDCIAVYKAWSLEKRLWKLDDPKRVTKAKHRLITALRRNPIIEVLKKEPTYYRFRLTDLKPSDKRGEHSHTNLDTNEPNSSWMTEDSALLEKQDVNKSQFHNGLLPTAYEMQLTGKVCVDHFKKDTEKNVNNEISCTIEVYEIELDNGFQSPFLPSEMNPENGYLSENDSWSSGRCCCKVLLDSTILCNEMCIWHGAST